MPLSMSGACSSCLGQGSNSLSRSKKNIRENPEEDRLPPDPEYYNWNSILYGKVDNISQTFDVSCQLTTDMTYTQCSYSYLTHFKACRITHVWIISLLYIGLLSSVSAFNIDLENAVTHKGPSDSMFGFAVAQHIDQSTNWLLIGAPRTQTSQRGIEKGGAVFRCKVLEPRSCQEVPFDRDGNNINWIPKDNVYKDTEDKSNQWLGATVKSSGENGVIVACAPRYIYTSKYYDRREPVGMCFVARSSTTKYERFSPCKQGRGGFGDQGYCQAGVSAVLSKDGSRLMIGAPGSYYWQGQLFQMDTWDGSVLRESEEDSPDTDYGYMGYASAIGEFNGDPEDEYVVGIPKGSNSTGMVEIYSQNMTVIGSLEGEQIGSYFGSALEVMDLNDDGLDDIVVGAPFFADTTSDAYENGRVYIYYQTKKRKFKERKKDILHGSTSQSRFGMAISKLGDINLDGFDDLCVGAPYAGEDMKGAIFIYHGSNQGVITNPTQVIYAKDIGSSLSTFGISVSGGWDQDDNRYPDLLVGAYSSDRAVFLRTRPVVKLTASLNVDVPMIDLKFRKCFDSEMNSVACIKIHSCFSYTGQSLPDSLYLDVKWTLDARDNSSTGPKEQRAFFVNSVNKYVNTQVIKVFKNVECETSYAHVKDDIVDKLTPIKILLEFKLSEEKLKSRRKRELKPILDARVPTWTSFTAEIKNDCGDDKVCFPDLIISSIRVSANHVIGSKIPLEFLIIVDNRGEDSFNTKVWITLPPGVVYDTISNQRSVVPISCGTLESNNRMVVCDVGNPMKSNTESEFTLVVTPTNTNDTQDVLVFALSANSSNIEEKVEDYDSNFAEVRIPVTAVPEISIQGKSNPEFIVLNTTKGIISDDESRLVKHSFQVRNQGNCAIKETRLQVLWPSQDKTGAAVLSLKRPLVVEGNGKCNITIIAPENALLFEDVWWKKYPNDLGRDDTARRDIENTRGEKIDCSKTGDYCTVIQCVVGYLAPYKVFDLTVVSQLRPKSFLKSRVESEMYRITSVASAKVLSIPYDFKSVDTKKFPTVTREAVTVVHTDRLKPASKGVKMWIIALAITAGLLLLILLILLLWFCGFFKRKKPEEGYFMVNNGKSYIDNKILD